MSKQITITISEIEKMESAIIEVLETCLNEFTQQFYKGGLSVINSLKQKCNETN